MMNPLQMRHDLANPWDNKKNRFMKDKRKQRETKDNKRKKMTYGMIRIWCLQRFK